MAAPTGQGAVYLYETVGLGDRDPTGDGAVYLYETVGLGTRDPTGQGAVYLYENPTGPIVGRGWVVGAIGWGATSPWIVVNGIWDVSGTPFAPNTGGGKGLIVQAATSANAAVEVTVTGLSASAAGVGFRLSDVNNFWYFALTSSASFLYKVVANAYTQVGTWAGASGGDVLTVITSGTSITVKRNGGTLGGTTDSFNSTATEHGIYSESTGARFSDFSIT